MKNHLIAAITNPALDPVLGADQSGAPLGLLMARLYRTAVMVGGVALLLYIAWAGINWITAGGDKNKVEEAKNRLTNAIVGMVILVAATGIIVFLGHQLFGMDLLNPSL